VVNDLLNPPAIVRPAEDLATLAAQINREHAAGEEAARRGLEHFRRAGEALLKAKEKCGHGKWLPWLKANVKVSQQTASAYMRLAEGWGKLPAAGNFTLRDALKVIAIPGGIEDALLEEWRSAWNRAGVSPPAGTVPELNAWLASGLLSLCGGCLEIPDDRDGYRVLLRVLQEYAAAHLVRTGKMLPPPPPPRPAREASENDFVQIHNDGAEWNLRVQCSAGRFLNWCEKVGIRQERRRFVLPEEVDTAALAEAVREVDFSRGGGPEDDQTLAELFGVPVAELGKALRNWMVGHFYGFLTSGRPDSELAGVEA
jgi:hypothetical protein